MEQKLEKKIANIKKIMDTKDYPFEDLFASDRGKIFSNHIKETENFCQKYFFIPMIGRFAILIQMILQWTETEEFKELAKDKLKNEKDREALKLLEEYKKIEPNWLEESGLDYFTDEEEQMRFFTYLTIMVCSYLEIYVKDNITEIESKLIQHNEYYEKKYGIKVVEIRDVLSKLTYIRRNNAKIHVDTLFSSLRLKELFSEAFETLDFKEISSVVKAIIELRNEIVHRKPFPDISILDIDKVKPLKDYVEANLVDMDINYEEELEDYKEAPTIVRDIFEELISIIKPKIMLISLFQKIPEIINLYASIFDNIVYLYFTK